MEESSNNKNLLVQSAFSGMIKYLENNLLYDQTIPIAKYVSLDHIYMREISDYEFRLD